MIKIFFIASPSSAGFIISRILIRNLFWYRNVRINIFDQPVEWFAIQSLSQSHLLANVAEISFLVANSSVVISLVVVEPDFSQPIRVPAITATSFRELKWIFF